MIASNQRFQKSANVALVLNAIRKSGKISRVDIAGLLGLKKSSVTYIINELMEQGIVEVLNTGEASPLGGRKPVFLGIRRNFGQVLGLSIHPWYYRAVLTDMTGTILHSEQRIFNTKQSDFAELNKLVYEEVQEKILAKNGPLIGVGIGIPGYVDLKERKIIQSWSFELQDYDLGSLLEDIFKVPVFIDNDSNCCAWGEVFLDGSKENFIYVLNKFATDDSRESGQGIGLGIVIGGQVYYGSGFAAGEFHGIGWHASQLSQLSRFDEVYKNIEQNEPALRAYIVELLENLSVIVSALNPNSIIFSHSIYQNRKLVQNILANELKSSWLMQKGSGCSIDFTDLGNYEVSHGAAGMFLAELFSIPQLGAVPHQFAISWETIFNNMDRAV